MAGPYISSVGGIDYDIDPQTSGNPNPQLRAGFIFKILGHLGLYGSAVTAAAGANNGTSPPAPVVTNATDTGGTITFGSGTTPAAGAQVVVTFQSGFGRTPRCILVTELSSATKNLGVYISAISSTGFTLSTTSAPAASQANTVYSFSYLVME